ncbi:ricin-type beta-trefoil lectin domain protein [Kitasatospora sp. NPDC098652]|uniref:ricin-type beta-trefoil lectin domain protein n=1 Tax=Kitasatospora sp. NPDC098652 TaxID=3364095 RepID=UPI00380362BF
MLLLGTATTASAVETGSVTWQSVKQGGQCLTWDVNYINDIPNWVGLDGCGSHRGWITWNDNDLGNGYWQEKANGRNACLDSNDHGDGSGSVYIGNCTNNNAYQQWSEQHFNNGWRLVNHATGLCLDSNNPGQPLYTYVCTDGNPYQLWS